jgi:type III secretion system FlhB-like substrate exporter
MKPNDTVIAALNEMELSEVIPDLRYSNLFEVWFFSYREMQFGVDCDGIITLFDLTKF